MKAIREMKRIVKMIIAINKNIFVVKKPIESAINIGNASSIIKLNITLKLSTKIRTYSLTVVFKLRIVIFEEDPIDEKTFLFQRTISNFE